MYNDRSGVSTAGTTRVVTRIIISCLGHNQRALSANRSLFILKTDPTPGTVQVESSGILVPLDVGGGTGEQLDGAGEGDGAPWLDKHRGLSMDDSSGG